MLLLHDDLFGNLTGHLKWIFCVWNVSSWKQICPVSFNPIRCLRDGKLLPTLPCGNHERGRKSGVRFLMCNAIKFQIEGKTVNNSKLHILHQTLSHIRPDLARKVQMKFNFAGQVHPKFPTHRKYQIKWKNIGRLLCGGVNGHRFSCCGKHPQWGKFQSDDAGIPGHISL